MAEGILNIWSSIELFFGKRPNAHIRMLRTVTGFKYLLPSSVKERVHIGKSKSGGKWNEQFVNNGAL